MRIRPIVPYKDRAKPHLDWIIVAPKGQVVTSAQRRVLAPHMHLEVLEEVVVLARRERQQHAQRAGQRRVQQRLGPARDQRCPDQPGRRFSYVKVHHDFSFL